MAVGRIFLKFISNIKEYLCEALLTFFVVLLFVQILLRQFFQYSLP